MNTKGLEMWPWHGSDERAKSQIKNHFDLTNYMMSASLTVITNPQNLISDLSEMSVEDLKKMRKKDGQLTPAAQKEMSLRGDRCALIEFHRFMYSLSDADIKRLSQAHKQFYYDLRKSGDEYNYCDENLLIDAIQYHILIRDERQFDLQTAIDIADSFKNNIKLARNYEGITSAHMITFAQNILNKYTKKAADFQKAREILGLSQALLSENLGWTSVKQISNIETGTRPVQKQTELAIECLLRREKKWSIYLNSVK